MNKSTKRQRLDEEAKKQGLEINEVSGYFIACNIPKRFDTGVFVKNLDEADLYLRTQQVKEVDFMEKMTTTLNCL